MATKPRSTRLLKAKKSKAARQLSVKSVSKKPAAKKMTKKPARKTASKKKTSKAFPAAPHAVEAAVAAFAHEVRTPLTGILAISSLLATSDLGEREKRWVETITTGAEHLAALSTLYVDAAKSATARLRLHRDLFDLRAFARAAGESLAGRATANGLEARLTISDALPSFALGDVVRLRAALENLIDNAVKFTSRGEVGLDVSLAARSKDKIKVTFAVSDSGVGLSLADIRHLFRPFSQANLDVASRFGGAGLGLWSVKQLARALGGDISVRPRPGGGAVFALTVALLAEQDVPEAARGPAQFYPEGLKILSVEDNPFGRVVLNTVLGELGHKVEFVGEGEMALARIAQGQYDAVLMDMVLPGIDGIETIRRIRALGSPQNTIAIVGVSGREEDGARALTVGADAFLAKPVSPRSLALALRQAIARTTASTS